MPKPTRKKTLSLTNCPIARATDIIGDRWTLLILRELFHGATRFGEFAEILGAARNLLVDRLDKLQSAGLVERFPLEESPGREGYRLTDKGRATFPVIAALMQWGNDYLSDGGAPVYMRDQKSGSEVRVVVIPGGEAKYSLMDEDIEMVAGPGARKGTEARMAFIADRQASRRPWLESEKK